MNILKNSAIALSALLISTVAIGQTQDPPMSTSGINIVNDKWKPSLTEDGVIDRVQHINRALEKPRIREIDIAWKRRVWRVIDVRQKANQAFVYRGDEFSGGGAFIEILIDAIKKEKVKAYSAFDDRFTEYLTKESFEKSTGGRTKKEFVTDPDTGEEVEVTVTEEFDVYSITKYRVKEDWIFDRNRGKLVVEIVGIAPLKAEIDENGNYLTDIVLFWLYYPELREYLVNYEVYNPRNDMSRMSWADYLDGHHFSSYIYKTSINNPIGLDLEKGLRGLEEGERIEKEIFDKAMDMWEN